MTTTPARAPASADDQPWSRCARSTFRLLNRWFMVPAIRAGLGAWLGSPLGGWILLLRVRGRRSGRIRETPLDYLVAEGSVWVLAGFGERTEWYRNLLVDPEVEAWLPGRRVTGRAVEVRDPAVRERILPPLVRSTGLPAFLAGINPWRDTDAAIVAALEPVPLIRIDAGQGRLEPGTDDPGGNGWIWRQSLVVVGVLAVKAATWALLRSLLGRG